MVSIQLDERAHSALKLYKTLAGHRSHSEAVVALMEEAGHEVPEESLTNEELMRRVFG